MVCFSIRNYISNFDNILLYRVKYISIIRPCSTIFGIFFGFIPMWFVFITIPISIAVVLFIPNELSEQQETRDIDYWDLYADGLKKAYASKFGYQNTGFDDEVNKRIDVMKNCGRGFSRTIARDWLRRMHKFTEAK